MINIVHKDDLSGADRFGECLSCGGTEDVYKITYSKDDHKQQTSVRLCRKCLEEFKEKLSVIYYY